MNLSDGDKELDKIWLVLDDGTVVEADAPYKSESIPTTKPDKEQLWPSLEKKSLNS